MATRQIKAKDFGRVLEHRLRQDTKLLRDASLGAAWRGVAEASRLTVEAGLVDRGGYLGGWDAGATSDGAYLRNTAPYAGVIEYGRRPGAPGPPLAPILEWVRRKLVANGEVAEEEAESVAWAIRQHIHENGSPPHFILRDVSSRMGSYLLTEALRLLRS